jgi:hypothetical protein
MEKKILEVLRNDKLLEFTQGENFWFSELSDYKVVKKWTVLDTKFPAVQVDFTDKSEITFWGCQFTEFVLKVAEK